MEISERSPTRIDLAGGTLDLWPLYLFFEKHVTINFAIDIFTQAKFSKRNDGHVILASDDMGIRREYNSLRECLVDKDPALALLRAHVAFWDAGGTTSLAQNGFDLWTRSDSPVGGGLGGSSSLCVTLLKLFSRAFRHEMSADTLVRIASDIEGKVLQKPPGTQDYYPPIHSGLCVIHYDVGGAVVEAFDIPPAIEKGFFLVYTGKAHHSGINNWQVYKNFIEGDLKTREALTEVHNLALKMQSAIEAEDWAAFPGIFRAEFQARTKLAAGFTSPEIDRMQEVAVSHGAELKICGAGGGGSVMVWCPAEKQPALKEEYKRLNYQVLPASAWNGEPE